MLPNRLVDVADVDEGDGEVDQGSNHTPGQVQSKPVHNHPGDK